MKIKLVFLLLTLTVVTSYAQKIPNYLVKASGDTIYCKALQADKANGNVIAFKYTDVSGAKMKINGKKECEDIVTFQVMDGYPQTFDLIRIKADEPDGYKRHTERSFAGKLKVYTENERDGSYFSYRQFVVLPDGKYLDMENKTDFAAFKKLLEECPSYKEKTKVKKLTKESWVVTQAVVDYDDFCQ